MLKATLVLHVKGLEGGVILVHNEINTMDFSIMRSWSENVVSL